MAGEYPKAQYRWRFLLSVIGWGSMLVLVFVSILLKLEVRQTWVFLTVWGVAMACWYSFRAAPTPKARGADRWTAFHLGVGTLMTAGRATLPDTAGVDLALFLAVMLVVVDVVRAVCAGAAERATALERAPQTPV